MSSRPSISAPAALEPPRSFSAYAFPTGERAIIHAKKPPTETIGMSATMASISVRRREPVGPALLGQQSLREIQPLGQLADLLAQRLHILGHRLAMFSDLRPEAVRADGSPPDPLAD